MAEEMSKHCWATPKCGISTAELHFRFSKPIDYRFIIVRNPYHRMISFYNNKIIYKGVPPYHRDEHTYDVHVPIPHISGGNTHASFRQFMKLVGETNVERGDRHLKPQYIGVENVKFDAIVRCESYFTDMIPVCEALELDHERYGGINENHFPRESVDEFVADKPALWFHENGIPQRYDVFYDDELEEIVWNKYEKDFELFEYKRREI